jgi:hypothetical protein
MSENESMINYWMPTFTFTSSCIVKCCLNQRSEEVVGEFKGAEAIYRSTSLHLFADCYFFSLAVLTLVSYCSIYVPLFFLNLCVSFIRSLLCHSFYIILIRNVSPSQRTINTTSTQYSTVRVEQRLQDKNTLWGVEKRRLTMHGS